MGFWHTGYMEFHENVGLDSVFTYEDPIYACQHCSASFKSLDDLQRHRWENHPFSRPILTVRGIELGATPFHVTSPVSPAEFAVERANRIVLNDSPTDIKHLRKLLSEMRNDTAVLDLSNDQVSARFHIIFRIADDKHLAAVDEVFLRMAQKGVLKVSTVDAFIHDCREFDTALSYYDGICHYLYGVLAKESAPDSTIPFKDYPDRFNLAVDKLRDFNRPLARIVRGLVAFHFNHFGECVTTTPVGNLRAAASRFVSVLNGDAWTRATSNCAKAANAPEDLLTDYETVRILRWAQLSRDGLALISDEIRALVEKNIPEYDRFKLRILLAESYLGACSFKQARSTARELIGNPDAEDWAERVVNEATAMESRR